MYDYIFSLVGQVLVSSDDEATILCVKGIHAELHVTLNPDIGFSVQFKHAGPDIILQTL